MTMVDNSKRSFTQKAEEFMAMGLFKTHYAVVMFVTGVGDSGLVVNSQPVVSPAYTIS
jgi:uncharacterized membrane protein